MNADQEWDAALDEDVPRLARLLRETGAEEIEIGDAARTDPGAESPVHWA